MSRTALILESLEDLSILPEQFQSFGRPAFRSGEEALLWYVLAESLEELREDVLHRRYVGPDHSVRLWMQSGAEDLTSFRTICDLFGIDSGRFRVVVDDACRKRDIVTLARLGSFARAAFRL